MSAHKAGTLALARTACVEDFVFATAVADRCVWLQWMVGASRQSMLVVGRALSCLSEWGACRRRHQIQNLPSPRKPCPQNPCSFSLLSKKGISAIVSAFPKES